jgi:hypothetical protein
MPMSKKEREVLSNLLDEDAGRAFPDKRTVRTDDAFYVQLYGGNFPTLGPDPVYKLTLEQVDGFPEEKSTK